MNKVPRIDASFWIMKICATTLGETAADLMSMTLGIGYGKSTLILIGLFILSLSCQLASKAYHPLLFWTVILATSTAGTTMSDYMDRTLDFGYGPGSLLLIGALLAVLAFWRLSVGSISAENIHTVKTEGFFWAAVLISNTLGTAFGDFLADSSGLGFAGGALVIGVALALILAAAFFTELPKNLLFWSGFVLTRPFGATLGDFLSKSAEDHGLGFGAAGSSLILFSILIACTLIVDHGGAAFQKLRIRKLDATAHDGNG